VLKVPDLRMRAYFQIMLKKLQVLLKYGHTGLG